MRIEFSPRKLPGIGLALLVFSLLPSLLFAKDYDITSFGALSDGTTLNTRFIQAAIDQAHDEGGGRVMVPKGRFLSGSVILKTGVELHLEKGAVLLGSLNPDDYVIIKRWKALVMADHAQNIAITGKGTLDGQGGPLALHVDSLFYVGKVDSTQYVFKEKRPLVTIRPQIIEFVDCQDIRVTGVTIKDGASWVQSYKRCDDILIDRIRVESDTYWNNDGMDLIDCRRATVSNSFVNAADDGICLKSYSVDDSTLYCDSILIINCTVRSSASAIKLGTASYGGFRNVVIKDIKVYDTFRSAIALEMVDGGVLQDILVDGVTAKNTGNAIFIRLGQKYKAKPVGRIKNIVIRNVKVEVPYDIPDKDYVIRGPALPFFHNIFPSSIVGLPGHPVQNVLLENIEITYPGRGSQAYASMPLDRIDEIPEQPHLYPEYSMFGELPAWGFYVRHVEGLVMRNITVKIKKPDYRPAFVFDDVKGLQLESYKVIGDDKAKSVYIQGVE